VITVAGDRSLRNMSASTKGRLSLTPALAALRLTCDHVRIELDAECTRARSPR